MTAPRDGRIVTCEAMTSGHPDKLCDQISDALLDAHLVRDPYTRCGIEAAASANEVWVFGQVASADPLSHAEIETITRRVIRDAGYRSAKEGIDPETCKVRVTIDPQSQDIAQGVVKADGAIGASDQGMSTATPRTKRPKACRSHWCWHGSSRTPSPRHAPPAPSPGYAQTGRRR